MLSSDDALLMGDVPSASKGGRRNSKSGTDGLLDPQILLLVSCFGALVGAKLHFVLTNKYAGSISADGGVTLESGLNFQGGAWGGTLAI